MRVQVIFLEKFTRRSLSVNAKELRSEIINFWLVVIPVERFLARGGSWWLVVARGSRGNQCFGLWWLVVACGGLWWLVVTCVLF